MFFQKISQWLRLKSRNNRENREKRENKERSMHRENKKMIKLKRMQAVRKNVLRWKRV